MSFWACGRRVCFRPQQVTAHAKPLNDAQMCGSFCFYRMSNRIPFQKPYTSAHDLVSLLQSRGLTVTDTAKAESYLEYIGYYRLSAYMYPLLQLPKNQHRYKPNTTFSQVMMLYRFDKKLRLLIFNEIEKIPAHGHHCCGCGNRMLPRAALL